MLRAAGIAGLALLIAGMTAWAALAIYYSDLGGEPLRLGLAAAFALGTLGAFLFLPNRRRTLFGFGAAFAVVLLWWLSIEPSNERDWQTEVAVLPYATQDGDLVTLHNVRNFDYRTEQDFVPRYDDRTFDLRQLDAVDLIAVYWAGDAIAHIMVSFGFAGDHVAFSIETRKEKGEAYSSIAGFFKRYELIYVVGDERDLIRVRTDYRRPEEQVYLYRTRARPENARRLFLEYVGKINQLKERPEFYNTLTTNCTTDVWSLVRHLTGQLPLDWRVLLSGYFPEYAYELGSLDTSMPFAELKARSLINDQAHAADQAPGFLRAHPRRPAAPAGPHRTLSWPGAGRQAHSHPPVSRASCDRALGERLLQALEAAGPALTVQVAGALAFEAFVRQLQARAARRFEQLDGDHRIVAALTLLLPGPGEDQTLRGRDFPVDAAHDVILALRRAHDRAPRAAGADVQGAGRNREALGAPPPGQLRGRGEGAKDPVARGGKAARQAQHRRVIGVGCAIVTGVVLLVEIGR